MPSPPVPILATFRVDLNLVLVTFDKPLVPTSKNPLNYFVRVSEFERDPTFATVPAGAPTFLSVVTTVGPADSGPDVVTYSAAVPDLIGQNGASVVPFTQPLLPF